MARRPRVFASGLLYHVIVRSNQRRQTFRLHGMSKSHNEEYYAVVFFFWIDGGRIVSPTEKNWSRLVGKICEMKKLTSNSINNTNRAMLSRSGFGDRQTELYVRGSHAPTIDI
jgi:hypothetical protein